VHTHHSNHPIPSATPTATAVANDSSRSGASSLDLIDDNLASRLESFQDAIVEGR